MSSKKDPKLTRYGVSGYNKPKRTPNHPTKPHVVVAKVGSNGSRKFCVLARHNSLITGKTFNPFGNSI